MGIVVRPGNMGDAAWIVPLLQEGSQQGHFFQTVGMQAAPLLATIFASGGITMAKARGNFQGPCFVQAYVLVAEVDSTPASFLVCLVDGSEVELHLAGTRKQFRRKGCFGELVRHEIGKHSPSTKIYARCYKKSTWARDGLKNQGFRITKDGDPVELTL